MKSTLKTASLMLLFVLGPPLFGQGQTVACRQLADGFVGPDEYLIKVGNEYQACHVQKSMVAPSTHPVETKTIPAPAAAAPTAGPVVSQAPEAVVAPVVQMAVASQDEAASLGQLTDVEVKQAIAKGSAKSHTIGLTLFDVQTSMLSGMMCTTCQVSGYRIYVYTPEQWIELMAADAKREMKPFTLADVTPEMRGLSLHVIAMPSQASYINANGMSFASSVHRVVLTDTKREVTVQPLTETQGTVQSGSAFRTVEYTNAAVDFSMSDMRRLRAMDPKGEFFIVVVGDKQNKFFKVKSRDFKFLDL